MKKILVPFKLENTKMFRERMRTLTSIRKIMDVCMALETALDVPRDAVDLITAQEDMKELQAEIEAILPELSQDE